MNTIDNRSVRDETIGFGEINCNAVETVFGRDAENNNKQKTRSQPDRVRVHAVYRYVGVFTLWNGDKSLHRIQTTPSQIVR